MAVKYYSDFSDDDGHDWHIVIADSTYSGTNPLNFTVGSDGFALSYDGKDTDRSATIQPSTVEFSYWIQNGNDDQLLSDIAGSEEGRYMVEIYAGGATYSAGHLYWRGTLLSDISSFQDEYYPQEFRLLAIDDLAGLRDIPFETGSSGYVSLPALVAGMLNKMRVWDIAGTTHRATLCSWLEAQDGGGTWREIWTHGRLNMVSFTFTDTFPTTYRETYESLEGILSSLAARLYWRASTNPSVASGFVVDSLKAQRYDSDLLTGFSLNNSGSTSATTLARQEVNLDSSEVKRLRGFTKGFLNPLKRVERSFSYASNPFAVDHSYSGTTPSGSNFHDGSYAAVLNPAPTVEYEQGSLISLRFKAVFTHTAGSTGIAAFNSISEQAGKMHILVKFKIGQYYLERDLTTQGTSNTWVSASGGYCPVYSYTEDEASWEASSAGTFLEFMTPPLVWIEEQSKTFDLGFDCPPLPADLTSEDCTIAFTIRPVDADGLAATYTQEINTLFDGNEPQILNVVMYPTDVYEQNGSNITFKVENASAGAREVLKLPNVFFSDKLGNYGGGLFLYVGTTRTQPSEWQSPDNLNLNENLHNIVAKEWLEGQSGVLKKMSGEIRDFRASPTNAISLLDTVTHESINYSITSLKFNAARSVYTLDLIELKNSGSTTIQTETFSDGFDNPVIDVSRPNDTSPVQEAIVGDIEAKTDLITISQTVNLDSMESTLDDVTAILKTTFDNDGAGLYSDSSKATSASHISLTSTTAKLQAGGGNTSLDLSETSPGEITLAVQVGPAGYEISRTAMQVQGLTGSQLPNIIFSGTVSGIDIGDLDDVTTSGVQTNQVLAWNGTNFVPVNQSGGGGVSDTTEIELKMIFLEQ